MTDSVDQGREPNDVEQEDAQTILEGFFQDLDQIEGVDASVAKLITDLWTSGKLNRDAILASLSELRRS